MLFKAGHPHTAKASHAKTEQDILVAHTHTLICLNAALALQPVLSITVGAARWRETQRGQKNLEKSPRAQMQGKGKTNAQQGINTSTHGTFYC